MKEHPVRVISQHSHLRDLLPFYSLDMSLFGIAAVAATYALMIWLDPPAAPLVTLGSFVGMSLVNWTAKPSYLLIEKGQEAAFISALESIAYRYVPARDHWVPPLPRFARWKFNFVRLCPDGHRVRVTGPENALRYLASQLT